MSDSGAPELSRIVNLILDNPKLVEEISKMARTDAQNEDTEAEPTAEISDSAESVSASAEHTPEPRTSKQDRRGVLISAIKPYLSESRARAIDSMVSVAQMLEIIKLR